jgi:hypothetical protein
MQYKSLKITTDRIKFEVIVSHKRDVANLNSQLRTSLRKKAS